MGSRKAAGPQAAQSEISNQQSAISSMARGCGAVAGWLLVAELFYAPWDYGGTGAAAIRNLNCLMGGMILSWSASRVLGRARTNAPPCRGGVFWLCAGVLLVLGWGMTLNAHAIYDVDYLTFLPLYSSFPRAAGSVDYALSLAWMVRATLLLGTIWIAAELTQDRRWLLRVWWAIGLAGGSIALLGLMQKASGAEMIFWDTPDTPDTKMFFATYYYHANAGAYLNLTLLPVAGLAYRYSTRPANPFTRALWITLLVIMIVAVLANTSRMAQAVAGLMVLMLILTAGASLLRTARQMQLKTVLTALVVFSVALWAITQVSHLDQPLERWSTTQPGLKENGRWLASRAAWHALPEAGLLGFGPGTFSSVFPSFSADFAKPTEEVWLFLHNDYLQTVMEWGWAGGLLWAIIFFGGIAIALQGLRRNRETGNWLPRRQALIPLLVVALAGVAIHSLVDFPLQISSIQLYAATYLGICWGSGKIADC